MNMYVSDLANKLSTDGQKLNVVFSYIWGTQVDNWVESIFDAYYNNTINRWSKIYAELVLVIKEWFVDVTLVQQVQIQIDQLVQEAETAENFFQKFEVLRNLAWYDKNDLYLIRLIEMEINQKMIDQIYTSEVMLTDYDFWKKKIIALDNLWQQQVENWKGRVAYFPPKPQQQQQMTTTPKQLPALAPSSDRWDRTRVTYGGSGQPMELDKARQKGLCFKCSQQGHMSQDCLTWDKKFQWSWTGQTVQRVL